MTKSKTNQLKTSFFAKEDLASSVNLNVSTIRPDSRLNKSVMISSRPELNASINLSLLESNKKKQANGLNSSFRTINFENRLDRSVISSSNVIRTPGTQSKKSKFVGAYEQMFELDRKPNLSVHEAHHSRLQDEISHMTLGIKQNGLTSRKKTETSRNKSS